MVMARLPALIDLLTSFGGGERKTLDAQSRMLRDAGLLSPSKRGVGAAAMTTEDAATLLLAYMATDSAASTPEIVQRFAGLTNYLYEDPDYDRLQPRYSRANLMFWPLYSARTSLDALKVMIAASDSCWDFCRDAGGKPMQEDKPTLAHLAALGAWREAFDARRVKVSLDRVGRSLSITIDDIYVHKSSHKPYYLSAYDKEDIFASRTFGHRWAEFSRYDDDDARPLMTKVVQISGEALLKINQLINNR